MATSNVICLVFVHVPILGMEEKTHRQKQVEIGIILNELLNALYLSFKWVKAECPSSFTKTKLQTKMRGDDFARKILNFYQ